MNAFKTGNYSQAADEFRLAIDADPTFSVLVSIWPPPTMQQYVPGTDTPENRNSGRRRWTSSQKVLKDDPKNLLATQSIANLYFQAGQRQGT